MPPMQTKGLMRRPGTSSLRNNIDLVGDLVGREFKLRYRRSVLGWLWAWAQPLARLAVMGFLFTRVIPIDEDNYVAYLFVGLLGWTLFAAGVASVTDSLLARRELLMRPSLPRITIPLISVCTDAVDYLIALPILLGFLVLTTGLPAAAVWLPVILVLELVLVLGLGLLLSVANVYVRDTKLVVDLALLMGFYATPVFYSPASIPPSFGWVLTWNPMARLLDLQRAVLLRGEVPPLPAMAGDVAICGVICLAGLLTFNATTHSVVDEL